MSKRLIWVSGAFLAVAIVAGAFWLRRPSAASAGFTQLMNRGNGLLEKGDAAVAIGVYTRALRLSPESTDVRLNLANAYLLADRPDDAVRMCRQTLELDPNSAAAYYLLGCALLRAEPARAGRGGVPAVVEDRPRGAGARFPDGHGAGGARADPRRDPRFRGRDPGRARPSVGALPVEPALPAGGPGRRRGARAGGAPANPGPRVQPGRHRGRAGTLQVHPAAVAVRPEPAGSSRDSGPFRGGDRRGVWRAGGRLPRSAGRHRL